MLGLITFYLWDHSGATMLPSTWRVVEEIFSSTSRHDFRCKRLRLPSTGGQKQEGPRSG